MLSDLIGITSRILFKYKLCYSQAVQVDNTLYISGSLGLLPEEGTIIEGGVKEEAHQSLKNIGEILKAAGGSFNNGNLYYSM